MATANESDKNNQAVVEKESQIRRYFYRFFPIVTWIGNYKLSYLRFDIIAGIIVGLTVLPQCLAAGSMTGVKPHNGLAATWLGHIIYIMMGTAKDGSIGPSPIIAVVTGEFNAQHNPLYATGESTYTTLLSFMIGIILTVWGALQLTYLYNLFSIPVVAGFMTAAGFAVPCSQLRNFFGLPRNPMVPPGVLVKQIKNVFDNWRFIKPLDLAFGIPSLTYIILIQRLPLFVNFICDKVCKNQGPVVKFLKHPKVVRGITLVAATRNAVVFLVTTGVSIYLQNAFPPGTFYYTVVGHNFNKGVPKIEPPRFYQVANESLPHQGSNIINSTGSLFESLTIGFVVLPWVVAVEMIMGLKNLSRKNGYKIDPMQEMVAVGMANFAHSFIGGIPTTNATPRMALMDQLKSKTPLASLIAGTTALLFIAFGSDFFAYSPRPPIAAVIIGAGLNFIDFSVAKSMWKEYPKDVVVFTFTFLTCFFYDMTYGLLTSFLLQLFIFLTPSIKMHIRVSRVTMGTDENGAKIKALVIRLPVGLKYPSADKLCDRIERALKRNSHINHVIVDCKLVTGTDYTGIQAFRKMLEMAIKQQKNLVFSNMNETMRRKLEDLGLNNFRCAESVDEAVSEYNKILWITNQQASVGDKLDKLPETVTRQPMTERERRRSLAQAKQEQDEKIERTIQRRLSKQPHFYEDIPMGVGHGGDDDGEDDDDDEDFDDFVEATPVQPRKVIRRVRRRSEDRGDKETAIDGDQYDSEGGETFDRVSVSTFQFVASEFSDAHLPPSRQSSHADGSRRGSVALHHQHQRPPSRPPTPASVAKFLRRFSREQEV